MEHDGRRIRNPSSGGGTKDDRRRVKRFYGAYKSGESTLRATTTEAASRAASFLEPHVRSQDSGQTRARDLGCRRQTLTHRTAEQGSVGRRTAATVKQPGERRPVTGTSRNPGICVIEEASK